MKKPILILLAVCLAVPFASCEKGNLQTDKSQHAPTQVLPQGLSPAKNSQQSASDPDTPEEPFKGKIGIITDSPSDDFGTYNHLPIIAKYGKDKIETIDWSELIAQGPYDREGVICSAIEEIGKDHEVTAVIANPILLFSIDVIAAFTELKEKRDDILLVYCLPESSMDSGGFLENVKNADLVLALDEVGIRPAAVRQAHKLGAETFVYYPSLWGASMSEEYKSCEAYKRELIKEECTAFGIQFVEVLLPESLRDKESTGLLDFIYRDVPGVIQEYGKDTAFFSATASSNIAYAAISARAIYPHPADLWHSPFNYYVEGAAPPSPLAGGDISEIDTYAKKAIEKTRDYLAELGMLGRVSSWPVPYEFMFTYAATEYAIKWINGEVKKEGIDVSVLGRIMEGYTGVKVYLTPYIDRYAGSTYENILLMRMEYITY